MASKVVSAPSVTRHATVGGIRRCKSHEPGQRVMTEAIAFLFSYSGSRYKGDTPSVEEFLDYVRGLSLQTYHTLIAPGVRRRLNSRLLGGPSEGRGFELYFGFLESVEPLLGERNLATAILQAQNIGLRALTLYNAFVVDSDDDFLRTHVAEPFVWYSRLLYHDSLDFQTRGLGVCLSFVQSGVMYLNKHVEAKNSVSAYFIAYDSYAVRGEMLNKAWGRVLQTCLMRASQAC